MEWHKGGVKPLPFGLQFGHRGRKKNKSFFLRTFFTHLSFESTAFVACCQCLVLPAKHVLLGAVIKMPPHIGMPV